MKTKPTQFTSGEALISLFYDFCNAVRAGKYRKVPTQTEFCSWLAENYKKTDRKTIYNTLNKIFPEVKKEFERLQGDVIAEGAMLKKYQPIMSMFALKNWCGWRDKSPEEVDIVQINSGIQSLAQLLNNPAPDRKVTDFEK